MIFKNPSDFLSFIEEKNRYAEHQNSIEQEGYVTYLSDLLNPILKLIPANSVGLDYGCGPGPTLSLLFEKNGYQCHHYDPAFFPNEAVLQRQYDFVTSTEVFEHLHSPAIDIEKIWKLVKPGGVLGVMTSFYPSDEATFEKWWYKNDPTHVCFYNEGVFEFLAKKLDANLEVLSKKSVILKKKLEN